MIRSLLNFMFGRPSSFFECKHKYLEARPWVGNLFIVYCKKCHKPIHDEEMPFIYKIITVYRNKEDYDFSKS